MTPIEALAAARRLVELGITTTGVDRAGLSLLLTLELSETPTADHGAVIGALITIAATLAAGNAAERRAHPDDPVTPRDLLAVLDAAERFIAITVLE